MGLVAGRIPVILCAVRMLCLAPLGSSAVQDQRSPAEAPTTSFSSAKPQKYQAIGEQIYRPSIYLEAVNGYFFVGLTNTNGTVPMMSPDPEVIFDKIAITSILISRFSNGPFGPFDYLSYIVQAAVNANNRTITSGKIVFSYINNTAYCWPDGPLVDRCYHGLFKWKDIGLGCETLGIYDPAHPDKLLVGFERLCRGLPFIVMPNTTYLIPRLSPIRLSTLDTIVPVEDGVNADGTPKVVDHVLADFDMEAIGTIVSIDRITGPKAPDFVGVILPIGLAVNYARIRWGTFTISPYQISFPPDFPWFLIPYQLGFTS